MKATSVAALLSLFVMIHPLHAGSNPNPSPSTALSQKKAIDLNKAELSQLIGACKGIGKKRAEAIIAYRDSHHGFKSLEELAEVKGIGSRFVEKNREALQAVFVVPHG